MVAIEVDREFERLNALLGMHSWSEFLLAPTEEVPCRSDRSGHADPIHRFVIGNR